MHKLVFHHSAVCKESTSIHYVSRLKAPVKISQNLIDTELSIAAGYVRYGGSDYNEGSAILVFDPKAKTLSGAQGLP